MNQKTIASPFTDFQHPATVRPDRALAVHAIMHNRATPEAWVALDDWAKEAGLERVLDDILAIVEMNQPTADTRERDWWRGELSHDERENAPGGAS
jgi:hypothetical protein